MKKYEVEFTSETCRSYTVEAEDKEAAIEAAYRTLDNDDEVSRAWKAGAIHLEVEQVDSID
jgi:hypothetical protein